jgi:hypothetical protein
MLIFMLALTLLAIVIHLFLMKERTTAKVVEVILLYLLVILVGTGALIAGLFHVFNGPATAALIGWPAGSPFQYEVGVADIALGLTAILCLFIRGNYWLGAILANSTFLLLCLTGHIRSMVENGNLAVYNIGPNIFISDLIIPLLLIILYSAFRKLEETS